MHKNQLFLTEIDASDHKKAQHFKLHNSFGIALFQRTMSSLHGTKHKSFQLKSKK